MSVNVLDVLKNLEGTDYQIGGQLHTLDGGKAYKYINGTGTTSVKGSVVKLDVFDDTVILNPADDPMPMGVVYEPGVADGQEMWVVTEGDAFVLLEDGTGATAGNWAKVSDSVSGRADVSLTAPAGGTIAAIEDHFTEMGHCERSASSGTDVLCKIHLHWN